MSVLSDTGRDVFILAQMRALGPERGSGCLRSTQLLRGQVSRCLGARGPSRDRRCCSGMFVDPRPFPAPVWVSVALPFTERQGHAQVAPGETRGWWAAVGRPANEVRGSDHSLQAQTGVLVGGSLHLHG